MIYNNKELLDLRRQAEERVRTHHGDPQELPHDQLTTLVHELEVHQIELEMQNDELHRSHAALATARDSYSDLFDFAPVGYFILDNKSRIVKANLTSSELFGVDRPLLNSQELFHFVAREHRDTLFSHLRHIFKNRMRKRQTCELEMVRGNGARFFAKLDSVAQPATEGDNPQCLTLVTDITELKQAEAASHQAREAAEKANQAKSHFLAAASHDLRQPLQAMTTISDVLKRKLDDPEALRLVDYLSKSLLNMNELFNALLNVNQLESGSIKPKLSCFPVNELLTRIDTAYRPLAEQKGLSLRIVNSSATIRSDSILLGQILDNLVSNAIRYTETGKVLVGCRRHGAMLHLEVWDTGIGIPEDQRGRIFDEFYQLDNPARERSKGLGLGLAIAARGARLLGQEIQLTSRPNGSLFSIQTPLMESGILSTQAGARESAENHTVSPVSLLVVEDNHIVLFSLAHLLKKQGYQVTGAMNSQEALAKISSEREPFDFIITDYRLPDGETGVALIEAVRQTYRSNIPALIITGDLQLTQSDELMAPDIRVLHKPVQAESLNRLIQEMLTSSG
ncbi:MAG: ATP-binding protein [Pseudomonadota bacterium]